MPSPVRDLSQHAGRSNFPPTQSIHSRKPFSAFQTGHSPQRSPKSATTATSGITPKSSLPGPNYPLPLHVHEAFHIDRRITRPPILVNGLFHVWTSGVPLCLVQVYLIHHNQSIREINILPPSGRKNPEAGTGNESFHIANKNSHDRGFNY